MGVSFFLLLSKSGISSMGTSMGVLLTYTPIRPCTASRTCASDRASRYRYPWNESRWKADVMLRFWTMALREMDMMSSRSRPIYIVSRHCQLLVQGPSFRVGSE